MKKRFRTETYLLTLESYKQSYSQTPIRRGWRYSTEQFDVRISLVAYTSKKWSYDIDVNGNSITWDIMPEFETVEEALDEAIHKLLKFYNKFAKDIITILEKSHQEVKQ